MGRMKYDPETKRVWVSLLDVKVTTRVEDTEIGPTNVSQARDRIVVKSKTGGTRYGGYYDVSEGQPHAKLDPRLDARAGKVCVAWCAMDHSDRQWRVYANFFGDGESWTGPMEVAGGERPALHPSVAIDPETGKVFIAYEDWADSTIRLTSYDGAGWSETMAISEKDENYRPTLIVTRRGGRHKGAVAVAWDSYRGEQYDIFLRLLGRDGRLGPETRVTESALWDCGADLCEDLDGNLWIVWTRASNALAQTNALREVRVRFFDGEKWLWPYPAEDGGDDNGLISANSVNWHPKIIVDELNRVHVFWRDGMNPAPPIIGKIRFRTYEGDRWSRLRHLKVNHGKDAVHMIWDFSTAVTDGYRVEGVWDSQYVKRLGFANKVSHVRFSSARPRRKERVTVKGQGAPERLGEGWPKQPRPEKREAIIGGQRYSLVFGDTHTHSWTSDGADPADFYYHFARDYAGLDYYALSDHDFTVSYTPGLEALISFLPERFASEDFICFQAFEFSSQHKGHRVVVFEKPYKPTFSMVVPPKNKSNTTAGLYRFLHRFGLEPDSRVLVTAHNMFNLGNDFKEHDENFEPLYDVTSLHVIAEKPFDEYLDGRAAGGNKSAVALLGTIAAVNSMNPSRARRNKWFSCWRQCLDDGLPLGAYGTSDTHAANAIGYVTAGLWVREKTGKAIFDAMFARRSTGLDSRLRSAEMWNTNPEMVRERNYDALRADIRFFLDDHFMGEKPSVSGPPQARAEVYNQDKNDPARAVVFIKDGMEVHTAFPEGNNPAAVSWRDEEFEGGRHYYYVRVDFKSGNVGFSSPVFVNY